MRFNTSQGLLITQLAEKRQEDYPSSKDLHKPNFALPHLSGRPKRCSLSFGRPKWCHRSQTQVGTKKGWLGSPPRPPLYLRPVACGASFRVGECDFAQAYKVYLLRYPFIVFSPLNISKTAQISLSCLLILLQVTVTLASSRWLLSRRSRGCPIILLSLGRFTQLFPPSVWLDLRGGVDKTITLINEAASQGAKIVGFPEVFIPGAIPFASHFPRTGLEPNSVHTTSPGYPWTPWANSFLASSDVLAKYQANSMGLHSPEMAEIQAAAKATGSWVVLGFSERDGGSLYIVC